MKRKDTQKIVLTSIFIAIIALMTFTPYIGYINLGVISATTVFIPVVIGVIVLKDWRYSLVLGLAFGGLSMLKAWIMPENASDVIFINPLVSVLPRVLMVLVGHFAYLMFSKIISQKAKLLTYILTAFFTTLANSVLVLGSLMLLYSDAIIAGGYENVWVYFIAIMSTISVVEIIIAMITTGIVMTAVDVYISSYQKRLK
jgi:uncharacterized membrane protein